MKRARMSRVSDEIGRFGRSNDNRPKADDLDGKGGLENQSVMPMPQERLLVSSRMQ